MAKTRSLKYWLTPLKQKAPYNKYIHALQRPILSPEITTSDLF